MSDKLRGAVGQDDALPGADREEPWKDGDLLRRLYIDEGLSMNEIRKAWDCSGTTISKWVDKHGITKRSRSQAAYNAFGSLTEVKFHPANKHGYEYWSPDEHYIFVHRLVAVAEYGVEAVANSQVHHKNGIQWDNRPGNLELVDSQSAHMQKHKKFDGVERIRIAELYENGGLSSRKLADWLDYDISSATVLEIHKEFYDH